MGNRGTNVQEITRVHEVGIKFPDRAPQQNGGMFYLITNPRTFHNLGQDCCCRKRVVVGFTITYAIDAYHH